MLEFTDGTSISYEDAAQLMEKEGELILGWYNLGGERCALGVLYNTTNRHHHKRRLSSYGLAIEIATVNNNFEGAPAQRCEYMARWFREQAVS